MTPRKILFAILISELLGIGIPGCDIGVNPLLFDGTPVGADYRVDVTGTSYSGSTSIPLRDILESIRGEVDSISLINITLLVDSTAGTATTTALSGFVSVDDYTILTLSDVPISAFSSERSIFDKTITGFTFNRAGVDYLVGLLSNPESVPETVNATVSASSSSSPLHFTIHVKLYTQVFTKSKK